MFYIHSVFGWSAVSEIKTQRVCIRPIKKEGSDTYEIALCMSQEEFTATVEKEAARGHFSEHSIPKIFFSRYCAEHDTPEREGVLIAIE